MKIISNVTNLKVMAPVEVCSEYYLYSNKIPKKAFNAALGLVTQLMQKLGQAGPFAN